MLNDELNKYKETYGKLVEQLVLLHNRNLIFIKNTDTARPQMDVRAILKEIQIIVKDLKNQTKLVHEEGLENRRQQKLLNRIGKKWPGKYYPRKKKETNNDNDNNSTPDSI